MSKSGLQSHRFGSRSLVVAAAIAVSAVSCVAWSPARSLAATPPVLGSADVFLNFQADAAHDGVVSGDSIKPPLVKKWSVYLPLPESDPGVSFPVIVGDRVFVTAWSYGGENYAYALDLRTGQIDWGPVDIGYGGHWTSLTYDEGRLFVNNTSGDLMALDPSTGTVLWDDAGVSVDNSPTAVGGVLYSGPDVQAFNESTGQLDWWDSTSGTTGDPAIAGGTIYTAGEDDNLVADTLSGQPLWQYQGPDTGGTAIMPVVSDGQVFVRSPTVSYTTAYPGWIHAASNGSQTGSFNSDAVPAASSGFLYGTITTAGPGQSSDTYELEALNRSTGAKVWTFDGDNQLTSSPLIANGVVYEGSWGQDLYALNANTGEQLWSTALGGAVEPSDETQHTGPLSGLGIGGGYLVVPTTLNGTSTGPTLTAFGPEAATGTLSADSVDFGSQPTGVTSLSGAIALTNTGGTPLSLGQAGIGGLDASSFTATADNCSGATLAAGATCTVSVAFDPGSTGQRSATLDIPAADGSHTVALTGDATTPTSSPPPPPNPTPPQNPTPSPNPPPPPDTTAPPSTTGAPAPVPTIPASSTTSALAINRALQGDRALLSRRATISALRARGRCAAALLFPASGTMTVQLKIPGHRAIVTTLAHMTFRRSGTHVVTLRIAGTIRRRLSRSDRILLSFRPGA